MVVTDVLYQRATSGNLAGGMFLGTGLDNHFPRACADMSQCWIEPGAGPGGVDRIHIWAEPQQSEFHSGGTRWLEPSIEIVGYAGQRPEFVMHGNYSGSQGNEWPWTAGRLPAASENGGRDWFHATSCTFSGSGTLAIATFRFASNFTTNRVRIGRSRQVSVHAWGEWMRETWLANQTVFTPGDSALAYTPTMKVHDYKAQNFIAGEFLTQVTLKGVTVPVVPFYVARINDTTRTPTVFAPNKRVLMITSGVHAGEDLACWFAQGFTKALLANTTAGNGLRSELESILGTAINGPGRESGGYRGGWTVVSGKDDANRNFSTTGLLDIVDRPKSCLLTELWGRVPLISVDFHGTGNYKQGFVKDAGESLHTEFYNRIVAKTDLPWTDEADTLTGHLAGWSRGLGTQLHLTLEFGDTTPWTLSQRDAVCTALVEVFYEMILDGLFT